MRALRGSGFPTLKSTTAGPEVRNLPREGRSKFGEREQAEFREGVLPHRLVPPGNRARAKAMRQAMPDAEFRLWCELRNGGLGLRFRRQHPIGSYIAGFLLRRKEPHRGGGRRAACVGSEANAGSSTNRLAGGARIATARRAIPKALILRCEAVQPPSLEG